MRKKGLPLEKMSVDKGRDTVYACLYTNKCARRKGADMGEKILEIEGITKKYKDIKLDPVSFSLEARRLLSVMGA